MRPDKDRTPNPDFFTKAALFSATGPSTELKLQSDAR